MAFAGNIDSVHNAVRDRLAYLISSVRLDNSENMESLNLLAEPFFMRFLNILFAWKLQNANRQGRSATGIDLIDRENRVVVQVSATVDHPKIQHSLDESAAYVGYRFCFVAITEKLPGNAAFKKPFQVPDGLDFDRDRDIFSAHELLCKVDDEENGEILTALRDFIRWDAENRALREYLDGQLEQLRNNHPSFKLMNPDDVDARLFPHIEAVEAFEAKGTRDGDGKTGAVWALIAESWQSGENRSIVIEGGGGIGKTVALLSPPDSLPAPALYLHLYELVEENRALSLTEYLPKHVEYADKIGELAARPWENGPSLLLLLDGFNEIPAARRREVLKLLNDWHRAHPGAQFIAVSRPLDGLNLVKELEGRPIGVTLAPLERAEAAGYLRSFGLPLPEAGSPVWEVLGYPLFLTLYAKTGRITETEAEGYPLAFREANSKGAIIWNYLQRELLRKPKEAWVLRCALACEYILPRIAWELLERQSFTLENREAAGLIDRALSALRPEHLPRHLTGLWNQYEEQHYDWPGLEGFDWKNFVLRELSLLVPGRDEKGTLHFSFPHQNFRDCLAGLYLVNAAEALRDGVLPEVWEHTPHYLALDYAAELMDAETAETLWEANRVHKPTDKAATYAQLELHRRRAGEPMALNFSGMDLRGLSLTRYGSENGRDLALFRDPSLSAGTSLDLDTFRGQGHTGPVHCVAVTEDGLAVSGSVDNTLRVWDTRSGECLHVLEGHTMSVSCVAVTEDGLAVSSSVDNTLRVWDTRSGECLHVLEGHTMSVSCVAVTKDGLAVSGSKDNTLRVWDIRTGNCLHVLEGHIWSVKCVTVTEDGLAVSGSDDGTLRVWNIRSGECLHVLEGHTGWVSCVAVTEDGLAVSGSEDNTLRVWDIRTGECLHVLEGHTDSVSCVAVTEDGFAVSCSEDSTLRVWEPRAGECLYVLEVHTYPVSCVAVTKDGLAVSGSNDRTLRVWDIRTGECLHVLEGHTDRVRCVAVTKDGLAVSGSDDKTLQVWDTRGECLHVLKGQHSVSVNCVAVTKDGLAVSGSGDKTLRVWELRSGDCLHVLEGHTRPVNCVAMTEDGLAVSGSDDRTLRVWELRSGDCLHVLDGHTYPVFCVAATGDGYAVSGSWDGTLLVWNIRSGECLRVLERHFGWVSCVAVTEDGLSFSGSGDRTLRVWELRPGECLHVLKGHIDDVNCVAVTGDGLAVSGSYDKTLRVWNLRSGKCLHVLKGHTGSVSCVAVTEDGLAVSGSFDNTLRVWDIRSGKCLDVWRILGDMDVSGMDFSRALPEFDAARALWQNGAALSPAEAERQRHHLAEAERQRRLRKAKTPFSLF